MYFIFSCFLFSCFIWFLLPSSYFIFAGWWLASENCINSRCTTCCIDVHMYCEVITIIKLMYTSVTLQCCHIFDVWWEHWSYCPSKFHPCNTVSTPVTIFYTGSLELLGFETKFVYFDYYFPILACLLPVSSRTPVLLLYASTISTF